MDQSIIKPLDADGDGHVSISELYEYLVRLIRTAETFDDYSNDDKHKYVLRLAKDFIGDELFHKHFDYIDGAISFIIYLSKHPKILEGINNTKKCMSKWCC